MSEPLLVERPADGVVLLTLALPERRNAMTVALTAEWSAALDEIGADPDVRAVIVTGQGRAFCAGGDLDWIDPRRNVDSGADRLRAKMLPFYRTWLKIRSLEVPTIAAVNGAAVGAGLCLALACDLRFAAEGATFSAPFTRLGMHPGMAATRLLPEAVGVLRARELIFTGRSVDAREAVDIGLVNAVVPAVDLVATALETALRIVAAAPVATRLAKVALRGEDDIEQVLQWEALAQATTMANGEAAEGIQAQLDRRPPSFAPVVAAS
ncbi:MULTISPECIES: enoyl-CoA hydratase/isomerase family protein [Protofrankia]|uniref:Enoyl-CoA hydratase/isomerase n=1 Tax=Candidatus Protofrankia datiscae TaxID=2716812 RepID=F8AX88_9ACTN|nr:MULTISPECIES: enoyl-CoA hydratase/isomerase family protein [Protofrankia]AEH08437.1 Enoyl-CoA hydratase/isomerase [Candidatus Protofrankia datiscae]